MNKKSNCYEIISDDYDLFTEQNNVELYSFEAEQTSQSIKGFAASPGVIEGPAIVLTANDNLHTLTQLENGAILVCMTASQDLAVVMPKLGAMVTEIGGVFSAASGLARWYKIPAVVGAAGITKAIKNGDIIKVDGNKGIVEIVKKDITASAI